MTTQTVCTTKDTITTTSIYRYGYEWHVKQVVTANDVNYSRFIEGGMVYTGTKYDEAYAAYNKACNAAQSKHTSESGQAMLLLLILIVGVILLLYVSYSGVSILSGSTNILGTMMDGLSEVLK